MTAPTYSVVMVYRSFETGDVRRLCVRGCMTFATLDRAYAYLMRCREHYTPGLKATYYEVCENYFTGAVARDAMGLRECLVYDALGKKVTA